MASKHFGIGVGSLVLILNPILLGGYTFGCHSFRHLVGGVKDVLSGSPVRKNAYDCVSCLNRSHMKWAWVSMFFVGFADLYVRLCAMGVWHDWRILLAMAELSGSRIRRAGDRRGRRGVARGDRSIRRRVRRPLWSRSRCWARRTP